MLVHLSILVFLLIINLIPNIKNRRKKYVLPISFFIIIIYWALRYDYGLDYWNYHMLFYNDAEEYVTGFGEKLFFSFTHLFQKYYQVIIAESVIIGLSLFYMVRKYIPEKCYWLFFFSLFAVYSFHFNLISAQRSTMAACIMYWAYELSYVNKQRWLLFFLCVFLAANFHTSALFFGVIPLFYYLFNSLKGKSIMIILFLSALLSTFALNTFIETFVSSYNMLVAYSSNALRIEDRNLFGLIFNLLYLVPTYYICLEYDKLKGDIINRSLFILAFSYLFIFLLGLDFQGRFTVYLFPFFIIALSKTCVSVSRDKRWIMLSPYILVSIYSLYKFYNSMQTQINVLSAGNPFFYKTIFDAPSLP